jgi:hypothetical protein
MTTAALKTIEATNYSDVDQTATTEYSYSTTHDVTVTAEWGVQVSLYQLILILYTDRCVFTHFCDSLQ